MSDCCSSENQESSKNIKLECPKCGQKCLTVSLRTILHHISQSWQQTLSEQSYFYCRNTECDAVYFSDDNDVIAKSEVRTSIGIKDGSDEDLICYCFGVTKAEAMVNKDAKEFVVRMTKDSMCSCDTANPSGRCCLRDFPKFK